MARYSSALCLFTAMPHLILATLKFPRGALCSPHFCRRARPLSWQRRVGFSAHGAVILSQPACPEYWLWSSGLTVENPQLQGHAAPALTQGFLRGGDVEWETPRHQLLGGMVFHFSHFVFSLSHFLLFKKSTCLRSWEQKGAFRDRHWWEWGRLSFPPKTTYENNIDSMSWKSWPRRPQCTNGKQAQGGGEIAPISSRWS